MGNEGPLLAPPEAPFNRLPLPRSDPRPFLPLLRGGLAWFTRAAIGWQIGGVSQNSVALAQAMQIFKLPSSQSKITVVLDSPPELLSEVVGKSTNAIYYVCFFWKKNPSLMLPGGQINDSDIFLFRSFQQLPCLGLPWRDFWAASVQEPSTSPRMLLPQLRCSEK